MQIRKKTLIIICVTIIALMVALSIVSSFILLKDYADLDESGTLKNVERVTNALSNEIFTLELTARDWACWDDTYAFIEDRNDRYIESNLVNETFSDAHLNMIVFVNSSGGIVYGRAYDFLTMTDIPMSDTILLHITPSSPLVRNADTLDTSAGIISLPQGPMLVVSCPILTSHNEGPARGTLLMGRLLDTQKISRIGEITALSLSALEVDDPRVPPDVLMRLQNGAKEEATFVEPVSDSTLVAYKVINDLYGNPSFVMQVEMPRAVFQQGQTSILNLILIVLGICLASGLLTLLFLEKFVLIPLGSLNASVDAIRQGTSPRGRVWDVGDDELSGLGSSINKLLEALDASRKDLEQSQERYRAVVENQTEAIARFRPDGTYTFANDAFCRLVRCIPSDITGRNLVSDIGGGDGAWLEAARQAISQETAVTTIDHCTTFPEGEVRWMQWTFRGIFDTLGILTEYQIVGRDMTERVRMEEQLRAAHRQMFEIIEFLPDATFVIDVQGKVIAWNRAIERMTGVQKSEIVGKGEYAYAVPFWGESRPILIDLIRSPNPDIEKIYDFIERREDILFSETFVPHLRGGKGAYVRARASPFYNEDGAIVGAIETVRDITEQRIAEQALRESEERFRVIFNTQQTGLIIVDGETHAITAANHLACSLFGSPQNEVLGKICHKFICPADVGNCPVMDLGLTVDSSERVVLNARGERIPVIKSVSKISIAGHPHLIESFVDIRKIKETEEALRRTHDKLELLASVTRHDILNQITAIRWYMDFAKDSDRTKATEYLDKAGEVTFKMQELLEFTRDYQNTGINAPEWQPVEAVFQKALTTIDLKGVTARSMLGGVEIHADPLLEKVFYNLIDNTLRHGNGVTEIAISWSRNGTDLVLAYADNGIGVTAVEKEIIFHKGYGKNTGFGLFLIKEILGITGIQIRETGEPGKGVRFEMVVPEGRFRIPPGSDPGPMKDFPPTG